jgi:hypothetical protein
LSILFTNQPTSRTSGSEREKKTQQNNITQKTFLNDDLAHIKKIRSHQRVVTWIYQSMHIFSSFFVYIHATQYLCISVCFLYNFNDIPAISKSVYITKLSSCAFSSYQIYITLLLCLIIYVFLIDVTHDGLKTYACPLYIYSIQ